MIPRRCRPLAAILSAAACAPAERDPGVAMEAYCSGLYVTHVAPRSGTVFFVSPEGLLTAADGWGPQTLSLSVDQGLSPQLTYEISPSLSKSKNDITRSVSAVVGFSVTASVNLTASSLVLVPTGAYYRLEAYPEYQIIDWDLRVDRCSIMPDTFLTTGHVYRPVGVHFRVVAYVGGAWNALYPPSPAEIAAPPPWWRGAATAPPVTPDAGANANDAGANGNDAGTGGDGG